MPRIVLCTLLILMFAATQGWAQNNPSAQAQKPDPNNPWSMWDIQQMIQRSANEVTKRYNLTPEQAEFTRDLMATKVNAFLDKHETKIRDIFTEVIKYQLAGQDPPADRVQQWTNDITPMFEEAKTLIVDGNNEFREILSDTQKKIHDIDLKVMEQNFADADKRLDRWQKGGFDPVKDMGRPPKPADTKPAGTPAAPAAPDTPVAPQPVAQAPTSVIPPAQPAGTAPRSVPVPPARTDARNVDAWEQYVRQFIQDYSLDTTQANQAYGILAESKKRVEEYRASRKSDYQKVQTILESDPKNEAALATLKDLDKRVEDLFAELKLRLNQIPTDSQRKAYELAKGKASTTQPTKADPNSGKVGSTRPAMTQPVRTPTTRPVVRPATRPLHTRPASTQPSRQP